jgi:hypothetical protein
MQRKNQPEANIARSGFAKPVFLCSSVSTHSLSDMPKLTSEQNQAVASWVAAGDSLSTVQKKLLEQFDVSLTYMDVRFLIDDLDLKIKDAAPKADANDVTKAPARPGSATPTAAGASEKKGFLDRAKEKLGLGEKGATEQEPDEVTFDDELDDTPAGGGTVRIAVDNVTLIPGALASGTVTFSDGVTGKWIVDNYGRPGFTEISQPGYRPNPADAQAFMRELNVALQQKGY